MVKWSVLYAAPTNTSNVKHGDGVRVLTIPPCWLVWDRVRWTVVRVQGIHSGFASPWIGRSESDCLQSRIHEIQRSLKLERSEFVIKYPRCRPPLFITCCRHLFCGRSSQWYLERRAYVLLRHLPLSALPVSLCRCVERRGCQPRQNHQPSKLNDHRLHSHHMPHQTPFHHRLPSGHPVSDQTFP